MRPRISTCGNSFSGALTFAVPSVGKSGALAMLTRDWSLDTVIVARTGFPFQPAGFAPSSLGASHIRPDLVTGQPFYVYGAQCAQVFGPVSQGGNGTLEAGQACPGGMGLNPAAFDSNHTCGRESTGNAGSKCHPWFRPDAGGPFDRPKVFHHRATKLSVSR